MKSKQNIRRNNHFVPAGLLRSWLWEDNKLRGHWWDQRRSELRCKERGVRSFCFQVDLLTTHGSSDPSDQLEKDFERIDTPGIVARDRLLKNGPGSLSVEQRRDFARLLMSLEARRPTNVTKARARADEVRQSIDGDPEIIEALRREGITEAASSWWDRRASSPVHESSFENLMRDLTDRPDIGRKVINANWHVVNLADNDGTFVLGDRPLIRSKGMLSPGADWYWVLPLGPKHAVAITNSQAVLDQFNSVSRRRLCKQTNTLSAAQAERFVFAADRSHSNWLGNYLSKSNIA